MAHPEILLEYKGPVNLRVIDSLLKKLKSAREFNNLNQITSKRLYAIIVECLDNIFKHSAETNSIQPFISVILEKNKILIRSANPLERSKIDRLVSILKEVNKCDEVALKTLFDNKINTEIRSIDAGAGLGLLQIALKSRNNLVYHFTHLSESISYFEIEISLNKYIMKKLFINQTASSPKVVFDPDKMIFEISGESRPADVREFYDPILSWLNDFSLFIAKNELNGNSLVFNFRFDYFNSSSGKYILDICKKIASFRSASVNLIVNWHVENGDDDMKEVGKEISGIVRFPFEIVEVKSK